MLNFALQVLQIIQAVSLVIVAVFLAVLSVPKFQKRFLPLHKGYEDDLGYYQYRNVKDISRFSAFFILLILAYLMATIAIIITTKVAGQELSAIITQSLLGAELLLGAIVLYARIIWG